jgi:DNA-binding LacI/PurR family transcriptional regulator
MHTEIIKNPRNISSQIIHRFQQEIESGLYLPNIPLPSYASLAETYGVSKSTVFEAFKTLAGNGYIYRKQGKGAFINPDRVKTRIQRRMRDVAYIAFNIFSSNDNQVIPLLESLNGISRTKGANLHMHFIHGMSVLSPENSLLKRQITDNQYQGLIIASPLDMADMRWLSSLRIPFVLATSRYEIPVPKVLMDHAHAVRLAGRLFKKQGARRILVFTGPLDWKREKITPYSNEIHTAFETLRQTDDFDIAYITCDYSYLDAKEKTQQLYQSGFDGLFFQTDIIAKGAMAAFSDLGVDMSRMSCINYCDLEEHIAPVNIKKPVAEMGRRAFELLLKIFHNRNIEQDCIVLKPELMDVH